MENKIKSVSDFIKRISEKTLKLEHPHYPQIFWFRGEASIKYKTPLVPKLYRKHVETLNENPDDLFHSDHLKRIENNIKAEFSRKALPFIISKNIENTSWNRYFLMQHYKIQFLH